MGLDIKKMLLNQTHQAPELELAKTAASSNVLY